MQIIMWQIFFALAVYGSFKVSKQLGAITLVASVLWTVFQVDNLFLRLLQFGTIYAASVPGISLYAKNRQQFWKDLISELKGETVVETQSDSASEDKWLETSKKIIECGVFDGTVQNEASKSKPIIFEAEYLLAGGIDGKIYLLFNLGNSLRTTTIMITPQNKMIFSVGDGFAKKHFKLAYKDGLTNMDTILREIQSVLLDAKFQGKNLNLFVEIEGQVVPLNETALDCSSATNYLMSLYKSGQDLNLVSENNNAA